MTAGVVHGLLEWVILCCLENLRERVISRPYPKPTQVDR